MGNRVRRRNLPAFFLAVPLGVCLCLAVECVVGVGAGLLSGRVDLGGMVWFVMLVGAFALLLALVGGLLFGLPIVRWCERSIMAPWLPVFLAVWGGFWGYAASSMFWALVSGSHFDLHMHMVAAVFGSPFGLSVALCWWYLRRRLEVKEVIAVD